jgi:uncharacterized protein YifE (UPF0438 family)
LKILTRKDLKVVQIEDKIVSLDVFEKQFCCDLSVCKGACCVAGDSGAPLEADEILAIEDALPSISKLLTDKSKEVIKNSGVAIVDLDGDLVTPLINNKECVFVIFNNGIAECAIEKSWEKGECIIQKPVSCHLYPIRLTKYNKFTAVNFHEWNICKPALINGKKSGMPLSEFAKDSLIRKFGKEWYRQLNIAAEYILKQKQSE